MASIPPNLSRVPNTLASRLALSHITRANVALIRAQEQLATQRAVNRPSDDIVKAAAIGVLDDRLERSDQLKRNYQHASAALGVLDNTLGEASGLALQARDIASEQANLTASASERASQAVVVEQMLAGLFNIANREGVAGFVLGGTTTSRRPVESFMGYYRYVAEGDGLTTDLDQASTVPITLGPSAVAGRSARVRGTVDLNPTLTGATRIADVAGARGLGVSLGPVEFSVGGGARVRVELAGADSFQDIADRVTAALREFETAQGVAVLGPGGVSLAGGAVSIDVAAGQSVEFFEVGTGITARDLGLTADPGFAYTAASPGGRDVAPRLTPRTRVADLAGVAGPLGSVRVSNAGREVVVDLSGAQTVEDIKNAIESTNIGVRVGVNTAGNGLDILTEVASGSARSLSISEVAGGDTATRLGVRTFAMDTPISDLNFGRGVSVVDNVPDPVSGVINQNLNTDMRITLGDGTEIDIDLRPDDLTTVGNVVAVMNTQVQAALFALGRPGSTLAVGLADDGNGITLRQDPSINGVLFVEPLNNSGSAEHLGLLHGTFDPASATLTGEDRAKVRVESLFTHLVDLRDSLRSNNVRGISLAGDALADIADQLAEVRGQIGGSARIVDAGLERETDRAVLDESVRSGLRDVDFAAAASRFSLLQTQLQAGLQSASMIERLTLLDYL
ncbi:MAG TPA: flagellin [Phycisphaerales bacterium]|nr:flagellin [Phycisphaerales bacterium]